MRCANGQVDIRIGDCRDLLRAMPDQSVNCIVTSPPYFGLRDYGTAEWEGGDEGCDHKKVSDALSAVATSTLGGGKKSTGHQQEGFRDTCGKCGARRIDRQIGLEQTPQDFVAEMVGVFREARRVLRDDGTLWLNLGDSYNGSSGSGGATEKQSTNSGSFHGGGIKRVDGLKPKDLIGIPWRVAFALQDDGWYLRQDIIWHKPNPMPESVRDRCTKAHEYLFLLTKSARYWYDAEAVKEAVAPASVERLTQPTIDQQAGSNRVPGKTNGTMKAVGDLTGRNKRSVWTVATQPYSEAHFATYPPALIEPCILAGCPKGGTVLDPFGGAGTTGLVAARHGRKAILCELNPAYAEMAHKRISREWRETVKEEAEPLGGLFAV